MCFIPTLLNFGPLCQVSCLFLLFACVLCFFLCFSMLFWVAVLQFSRHPMVELLTINNIWHWLGEILGQDLTKAPCIVKCVKIDKKPGMR